MERVPTADFDTYLLAHTLAGAVDAQRWVAVRWDDGSTSRFHHVWLRDNCPCRECVHDVTKEQTFDLSAFDGAPRPRTVRIDGPAVLTVEWAAGEADGVTAHTSRFDAGFLHAHRYDAPAADDACGGHAPIGRRIAWDANTPGVPPRFDGARVLHDDDHLLDWLRDLQRYGCALLHGVPHGDDTVGQLAERIGVVRDTNFGRLWDVRVEDDPITNANTALPLPPHVDLPTREVQPGLQLLHCLVNEAVGGESILVDGLRVAQELRSTAPDDFAVLTTVPWDWANRSRTTDHRWRAPALTLDAEGDLVEIRVGNWLRAPLTSVRFDDVPRAYEAYGRLARLVTEERFQVRFRLDAGDCMVFDNRRLLHARGAFEAVGRRHLRGCYSDRDELRSRLRVLERTRRARSVASDAVPPRPGSDPLTVTGR